MAIVERHQGFSKIRDAQFSDLRTSGRSRLCGKNFFILILDAQTSRNIYQSFLIFLFQSASQKLGTRKSQHDGCFIYQSPYE